MSFEMSALLVTWLAITLLAFVVAALVRQVHALSSGRVYPRTNEIGVRKGRAAPEHSRLAGAHDGELLLLFLTDGCAVCTEVLEEAEAVAAASPGRDLGIRAVFPTSEHSFAGGLTVLGGEAPLFDQYQVPATPFAVTVDAAGRVVGSEPVGSRRGARHLIERFMAPATADSSTVTGSHTDRH